MFKNIRIVPAILANDRASLATLVRRAETFADFAQIDIMDGEFVPSHSVSYGDIASSKPKFKWEAHLMINHPEERVKNYQQAGAQKIVFHFEAKTELEKTISLIRKLGMGAGLAINPETSINAIKSLVKQVDSVLFLSVNPGFYGAKFIPEVLDKIVDFRKAYPKMETGIDGGIKESNIAQVARSGVDVICVGSAIFMQPDPAASYRHLKELATAATA